MAARWKSLARGGHLQKYSAPTSLEDSVHRFTNTLTYLKTDAKKEILAWTLSSAHSDTEKLVECIAKLDELSTLIVVHVDAVEQRAKHDRKQEMSIMRKQQCERTRLLSSWRRVQAEERVPLNFLRYMLDKGILVKEHGDKTDLKTVQVYDTADGPLIFTHPWLVCFDTDGPGRDLARLRHAIGEKRLDDGMYKAEQFISKDANRISTDLRVAAQGGGNDHVEDLAWVPAEWRAKSYTPESLRSIGAPWILSDDIASARKDPIHWPMAGFGHFLSMLRGSMVTCLILGQPLFERGCSLHACIAFLGNMTMKEFEDFVVKHCVFAELEPGTALWVPYGWRCVLLTRTQTELSHILHVPYVCSRMILSSATKDETLEFAKRATQEWGTFMQSDVCMSMSREAVAWLDNLDTTETTDHGDCQITLKAIEDLHESQV